MKNLMIYLHPKRKFDWEHKILVKIQIDNSLELGWEKEDINLITNFPYEYKGIRSNVIDDKFFCTVDSRSTKITTINHLFLEGLIDEKKIYWMHDFDAFQLFPITREELGLNGVDVGYTTYGWSPKWNTGSVFFKFEASDIFKLIEETIHKHHVDEERALVILTQDNINDINERYKKMDSRYNIGMRKIEWNINNSEKPIKVLHFHPRKPGLLDKFKPHMPDRLLNIFKEHGYE